MDHCILSTSSFQDFQQQAEITVEIFYHLSDSDKERAYSLWNLLTKKIRQFSAIANEQSTAIDRDRVTGYDTQKNDGRDGEVKEPVSLGMDDHDPVIDRVLDEVIHLEAETELLSRIKSESQEREAMLQNERIDIAENNDEQHASNQPTPAATVVTEADTKNFTCSACPSLFETETAQKQHYEATHTKEKRFKCEQCPASFAAKGNFNVHLRSHSHSGNRPFKCSICSSMFATSSNLRRHILTHQGLKPYRCSACQSCFSEKRSLIIHSRKHTGERPFSCPHCSKTFMQNSVLQNHLTVHTNEKKYSCSSCAKSFKQKSHLQRHTAYVHKGVKNKVCPECNWQFVTQGDLERHLKSKSHSGEMTFLCAQCGKRFMRQSTLNEHVASQHRDLDSTIPAPERSPQ